MPSQAGFVREGRWGRLRPHWNGSPRHEPAGCKVGEGGLFESSPRDASFELLGTHLQPSIQRFNRISRYESTSSPM